MGNDCCRSSAPAAVAVPCVYDINFIVKAMMEKTVISIEGISGTVESIARHGVGGVGMIRISFTHCMQVTVNAR
jgi:hypothetical protein